MAILPTTVQSIEEPKASCCEDVLRNKYVYSFNCGCQLLGGVTSLTAAIAGYYFASISSENQNLGYALGGIGSFFSIYNFFALSYTIDYKKVLDNSKKVEVLQQAKDELERQIAALDNVEQGISKEGDELEENTGDLRNQVDIFSSQVFTLEAELKKSAESETDIQDLTKELKAQEQAVASGIGRLSTVVNQAIDQQERAHTVVSEAAESIESLERRLNLREQALLDAFDHTEEFVKAKVVKTAVETFKKESPHEYEKLASRYPDLKI